MVKKQDAPELSEREKAQKIYWKCTRLEQQARDARRKYDWEWVTRLLFVKGYHFTRYNNDTKTVTFSSRTGVRIPINLTAAHLRGVRNQVTSFQPKWEVLPQVTTDSAFQNARYSGKTLDYIYKKAQIKRKIKEIVTDALVTSIGIWQFDVDSKSNIVINRVDPFEFYVDPNVKSPNLNDPEYGADYVILTHSVPVESVRKNKKLENTEYLRADNQTSTNEYKRFLDRVIKSDYSQVEDVNDTIILKQAYIRERDENGEFKMRLITYVDSVDIPLADDYLEDPDYPFEILQGDISGGELYGEAWIKNLIPINKVINALEAHIFEYNHIYARGRFVVDKNSGVRAITNQHGQIIEKNRGSEVSSLPIPPLPQTPFQQLDNMNKHFEDLSGVHDVSLGRLPGTVRSGVAIAELRQSDATNQADLVDNLEDFLARAGEKILKLVSENWTTTKLVTVTGLGGKPEYFMAVGEKGRTKKSSFKFGEKELPLAVIGADNEVRVQVGSWLAYTKEARQEKLKEMFRLGAIDQQTYLQHAEFADIDGILERTREERILQSRAGAKSATVERQFGVQLDEESLAIAENELMNDGIEQHAEAGDDHELHMLVHKEDSDNPLVARHMEEHKQFQKWEGVMNTRPMSQEEQMGEIANAGQQANDMAAQGGMFAPNPPGVFTPPERPNPPAIPQGGSTPGSLMELLQ